MKFVHRGFEKLGKVVGIVTVLLLVVGLFGVPVLAGIAFTLLATANVAPIVGGGSIATAILVVAFLNAFELFAIFYIAPHVPIQKAADALLGPLLGKNKYLTALNMEDVTDHQIEQAITLVHVIAWLSPSNGNPVEDAEWLAGMIKTARLITPNPPRED
jgi:hypothetical protein